MLIIPLLVKLVFTVNKRSFAVRAFALSLQSDHQIKDYEIYTALTTDMVKTLLFLT